MGIRDRDYWREDAPSGDWDPEERSRSDTPRRSAWTASRVMAWGAIALLVFALVLLAVLKNAG